MATDLSGLSPKDCPFDCNPTTGCVITGSICGHPFKGGLQGALQRDAAVMGRFQQARKILDKKKLNLTGDEPQGQKPAKKKRKRSRAKPKKPAVETQPSASAT